MTNYHVQIKVDKGELKSIFDDLNQAQETIRNCYSRLQLLGVVVFDEKTINEEPVA